MVLGEWVYGCFWHKEVVFSKVKPSCVPGAEQSQAEMLTVSCSNFDKLHLNTFIWGNSMDLDDRLQVSEVKSTLNLTGPLHVFDDV